MARWQFWIDVGGTFTDCIGVDPNGHQHFTKVLSSSQIHGSANFDCNESLDKIRSFHSNELVGFASGFWIDAVVQFGDTAPRVTQSLDDGQIHLDTSCENDSFKQSLVNDSSINFSIDSNLPAPIFAIRKALNLPPNQPLPPLNIRLGTTRGTNALLTRTGARVAFVTTKGHGDLLRIGFQNRPDIFAIDIKKPEPLFETSVEIDERVLFDGKVEQAIDKDQVRRQLVAIKNKGIESLAICFMHAYQFNSHEQIVEQIARDVGFEEISVSHRVAPEIRIIPRAFTTVLDAYLNPVLRNYIGEIRQHLHNDSELSLFSSSGALVPHEQFTGKDSILSGPAGGVVGFSKTAQAAGISKSIGFDMGGTSTDVSRFDGEYHYQYESEKSGVFVVAPTLAIETIAAGGGSVCSYDAKRFLVGPKSAGADPGPACYGKGGPLCLTDINLFLGRIKRDSLPFPLDLDAVIQKLDLIKDQIRRDESETRSLEWIANGFLKIAVAKTALAIRLVSIQKGYDVTEYSLVSFGGAAGQICCLVAEELGIKKILVHPKASVLSAYGIGLADRIKHQSLGIYRQLNDCTDLETQFESLRNMIRCEENSNVIDETANAEDNLNIQPRDRQTTLTQHAAEIEFIEKIDVRYAGTESYLTIEFVNHDSIGQQFEQEHKKRFGFLQTHPLEIGTIRVEGHIRSATTQSDIGKVRAIDLAEESNLISSDIEVNDLHSKAKSNAKNTPDQDCGNCDFQITDRASLGCDDVVIGPALIFDPLSTTVIDDGWTANVLGDGQLLISKTENETQASNKVLEAGPIQIELFNNQLFAIAEQMGETLRATAISVNVKERLDFSCAIFTADGDLIANAPHIPIHLGAMSECVKGIIEDNEFFEPGDVFVTNDPYRGGSHLPDVTVVTPVFRIERQGASRQSPQTKPLFWVASRAHHAEIGGTVPGSMPPNSTKLGEEGVLIQNFKVVERSVDQTLPINRFDELLDLLRSGPYPSRQPETNISDIQAQIAANQKGISELVELANSKNNDAIESMLLGIKNLAAFESRRVIRELPKTSYSFEDYLDCGAKVKVTITIENESATIDFTGTSPTLPNNLNANRAIVLSSVIYVFRLMIAKDIPLNHGILEPINLVLPDCFLNPQPAADPAQSPAMVGGNVETSQRVVDVLLGAFGIAAASQGTSNNVIFGDQSFGYYETICGGSGATANQDGADAVQVHITNTRITDPEILETRYPVILDEFKIRAGSGGSGIHSGGAGVIRSMRFTRPLSLSVLSNRYQNFTPFGLNDGSNGQPGKLHKKTDNENIVGLDIQTPGGGGWGEKS